MNEKDALKYKEEFFVNIHDVDPSIQQRIIYNSETNFLGRVVENYENIDKIFLTKNAAKNLSEIQKQLKEQNYSLLIYDGYRPQKSVDDFVTWSTDETSTTKDYFYPFIDKKNIFDLGYVHTKSAHSRGSTVDLTLINLTKTLSDPVITNKRLQNGKIIPFLDDNSLDMGSSVDLFDEVSFTMNQEIDQQAHENRMMLKHIMEENGFVNYPQEWWHFTLENEPFKNTYFNFSI